MSAAVLSLRRMAMHAAAKQSARCARAELHMQRWCGQRDAYLRILEGDPGLRSPVTRRAQVLAGMAGHMVMLWAALADADAAGARRLKAEAKAALRAALAIPVAGFWR